MNRSLSVVVCLGLPGSASTWLYNVCAQLLSCSDSAALVGYADGIDNVRLMVESAVERGEHALVIKSHTLTTEARQWLASYQARYLLSVRDPRDCIVSLMERFGMRFEEALHNVELSCIALLQAQQPTTRLFRYETRYFEKPQTLRALAAHLDRRRQHDLIAMQKRFSRKSIDNFIGNFPELNQDRLIRGKSGYFDSITQWHHNHFGDGSIGKWRERLSAWQQAVCQARLGAMMRKLGYEADTPARPNTPDFLRTHPASDIYAAVHAEHEARLRT